MDELRTVSDGRAIGAPQASQTQSIKRHSSNKKRLAFLGPLWGLLNHAVIWIGALAMILPFLWMLSTSLKTQGEAVAYPPVWIPNPIQWNNYVDVLQSFPFFTF